MHVRVVEAGKDKPSFRIDHFCVGAGELFDFVVRADCYDPIPVNRDRCRGRMAAVHRMNVCIYDDQISSK